MNQPKRRFLFERIITTPSESSLYHRGRIKIESPEQFVPIYLANYAADAYEFDRYGVSSFVKPNDVSRSNWMYLGLPTVKKMNDLWNSRDRNQFKIEAFTEIKRILNSPLPVEYTIVSNRGGTQQAYGGSNSTHLEVFTGYSLAGPMAISSDYNILVGLGLIAEIEIPYFTTKSNQLYQATVHYMPCHTITPEVVVVVKYKYLHLVRASLFLKQGIDVPYDAIKLIRRHSFGNSRARELYEGNIASHIRESGILVEYSTPEEMSKYLFPPKLKKTREAYLEDAKRALTEEVPHVIF